MQLHEDDPQAALGALTTSEPVGLYSFVFAQWSAAVKAEAAVLAGAPNAGTLLAQARAASAGNPMARAITRRAAALASGGRRGRRRRVRRRRIGLPVRPDTRPRSAHAAQRHAGVAWPTCLVLI